MPAPNTNFVGNFEGRGDQYTAGQHRQGSPYLNLAGYDIAPVHCETVDFAENGAHTYTGTIYVPAGAIILDIQVLSTALWTAATSAAMDVGDANSANGWYAGINLKATDLLVGEVIRFGSTGGKEGSYIVVASGALTKVFNAAARSVIGVITSVGAGVAGRTKMVVMYAMPYPGAAVVIT